ncbi:hypothetical protein SRHO_G00111950 [Serrasalmus rhombeus]
MRERELGLRALAQSRSSAGSQRTHYSLPAEPLLEQAESKIALIRSSKPFKLKEILAQHDLPARQVKGPSVPLPWLRHKGEGSTSPRTRRPLGDLGAGSGAVRQGSVSARSPQRGMGQARLGTAWAAERLCRS